jgi:uncharacterized membrane protein YjfL (UPF0719 family)
VALLQTVLIGITFLVVVLSLHFDEQELIIQENIIADMSIASVSRGVSKVIPSLPMKEGTLVEYLFPYDIF